jgi:predicted porin
MWLGASYNELKATVTAAYYKNAAVALMSKHQLGNESTKNTVMVGVTYALSSNCSVFSKWIIAVSMQVVQQSMLLL